LRFFAKGGPLCGFPLFAFSFGTTTDIYVKEPGSFGSTEVFVELKRNLLQKTQLDRLVCQIESLQPRNNAVLIVLCGDTNPALATLFREKYGIDGKAMVFGSVMSVVVKDEGKPSQS